MRCDMELELTRASSLPVSWCSRGFSSTFPAPRRHGVFQPAHFALGNEVCVVPLGADFNQVLLYDFHGILDAGLGLLDRHFNPRIVATEESIK